MKKSTISVFALTIFIILGTFINGYSKKEIKQYNGYAILEKGEKVSGKIHLISVIENQVGLTITALNNKTQITYKLKELKSYAFEVEVWNEKIKAYEKQWISYIKKKVERAPKPFGAKNVLINQLINGRISYYTYYYQCNADVSAPIKQAFYIEKSNHFVTVDLSNYAETLREMTYDYPELSTQIGKRDYRYDNLEKMIDLYNTYIMDFGEEEVVTQNGQ